MTIVKATGKGQVIIPAEIRKKYNILKGTNVVILEREGEIIVKPAFREPVKEARGMFKKGASALKALMADRREESNN
ncbi:MAG: AbrB/MazE/SpoVT family DNA-binding domain-containing protein [Deltaproteobacteria bacterium]|nr:AbrB/MazE/SpoVT family DNA-binding domain-containing protein [Deltaproteobacteria bacterium]